jgi:membrane protease YdiL (CAAX protease family)
MNRAKQLPLSVAMYVLVWIASLKAIAPIVAWVGNSFTALAVTGFLAALAANASGMILYRKRRLREVGLQWNAASARNTALGIAGGAGSAASVIGISLVSGAARLRTVPNEDATWATAVFVITLLALGAAGEEMFFRGYGFQVLIRMFGAWATIVPIGVVFALLHAANPAATPLAIANTAGFGILFGYAFLRSGDLWLPIGLHFGWNFTLPIFGVNISGFTMGFTNYAIEWTAGPLWSGGDYGVEGSLLTSGVLLVLSAFVWRAPVLRQRIAIIEDA